MDVTLIDMSNPTNLYKKFGSLDTQPCDTHINFVVCDMTFLGIINSTLSRSVAEVFFNSTSRVDVPLLSTPSVDAVSSVLSENTIIIPF